MQAAAAVTIHSENAATFLAVAAAAAAAVLMVKGVDLHSVMFALGLGLTSCLLPPHGF